MKSPVVSITGRVLVPMRAAGLNPYIGFIEWAREQIENYAEMFRKQVYTSDVDPSYSL